MKVRKKYQAAIDALEAWKRHNLGRLVWGNADLHDRCVIVEWFLKQYADDPQRTRMLAC